ncbi:hypothetical protein H5410_037236 [Solanum commersonii]|uniref:Uncharacterized protein n=1 Tax=Solanum commersonii TaxID=4109 RepID=A0A9J5Y9M8_SOLCO|nr:hypothetical protein H5410_037236 [Solanum commersonii]
MMIVHQIDFSLGSLARKYIQNEFSNGSGNIIKVVYPPQSSLILPNNTGITFTAFQKFVEENVVVVSINEINNLISQNNYLGLYVKVLGEHISSLDKKLDKLTTLIIQIKNDLKIFYTTSTSKEELLDKKLPEFGAKPIDLSNNFADGMNFFFILKIMFP